MTGEMSRDGSSPRRQGSGCPRWVKLLLILSMAANLTVAGLVIGHNVREDVDDDQPWPQRAIGWIVSLVPEEQQDYARARFDGVAAQIQAARAAKYGQLPAVVAAMQAEPFDAASLNSALDRMFDGPDSTRAILRQHLVKLLAGLTPADRAVFAERFRERLEDRDDDDDDEEEDQHES